MKKKPKTLLKKSSQFQEEIPLNLEYFFTNYNRNDPDKIDEAKQFIENLEFFVHFNKKNCYKSIDFFTFFAEKMLFEKYLENDKIYIENELFVIYYGKVDLYFIDKNNENKLHFIKNLQEGEAILDKNRFFKENLSSFIGICKENCYVFKLLHKDVEEIEKKIKNYKLMKLMKFIRNFLLENSNSGFLKKIAKKIYPKINCSKNEVVFKPQQKAEELYLLYKGEITILLKNDKTKPAIPLYKVTKGCIFGEVEFLHKEMYSTTAICNEKSGFFKIGANVYHLICQIYPEFQVKIEDFCKKKENWFKFRKFTLKNIAKNIENNDKKALDFFEKSIKNKKFRENLRMTHNELIQKKKLSQIIEESKKISENTIQFFQNNNNSLRMKLIETKFFKNISGNLTPAQIITLKNDKLNTFLEGKNNTLDNISDCSKSYQKDLIQKRKNLFKLFTFKKFAKGKNYNHSIEAVEKKNNEELNKFTNNSIVFNENPCENNISRLRNSFNNEYYIKCSKNNKKVKKKNISVQQYYSSRSNESLINLKRFYDEKIKKNQLESSLDFSKDRSKTLISVSPLSFFDDENTIENNEEVKKTMRNNKDYGYFGRIILEKIKSK